MQNCRKKQTLNGDPLHPRSSIPFLVSSTSRERVLDRRSGDKPPFPSEFNGTPPASPPPSPPAGSRVVELHWIAGIREVQLPPSQHGQVAATPARAEEAEYVAEDSGESGEPSPENYAEAVDASDIFDEGPAFVRDGTSRAGWATLFVQIAMVMLGWFGFDAQANAECCGVTGPDERGRGSNRRDSEGRNRSENDDEPSFVDRVGGFFGRMFDDVAGEIMDVFGVDDEHFDGADTLPTSSKGLLTRWLPWVRSCKVRDLLPVVGDQGTRSDLGSLQKDLERLNLDAACMSTVHRIVAEFLERYPGIGYTQVRSICFDLVCLTRTSKFGVAYMPYCSNITLALPTMVGPFFFFL